jgi:FKBP12-rapamycin complex-associated protein
MRILKDSSLSVHHTAVVQAVMYIFKTLGIKCVPFLPQIVPPFVKMIRTCPAGMLEFHFQQLASLIMIVKQHIRQYLPEIFTLIQDFWNNSNNTQITILSLIEAIAVALDLDFKIYLPALLPQILLILESDVSDKRTGILRALNVILIIGSNLEEYLHLAVPPTVRIIERQDLPVQVRKTAIQTIAQISKKVNFSDQASRIIHPLIRVLSSGPAELKMVALDCICCFIYQFGTDFVVFIPVIHKVLLR